MSIFKNILAKFETDREEIKENLINSISRNILFNDEKLTHLEQTEVVNAVAYRVLMAKKEKRAELLQEAREVQQALIDIKI